MQITQRQVGDVVILDLSGTITLGEGDELLKDKINHLLAQGHRKVVLDLTGVPYIDSAGLGEIVRAHTEFERRHGALKFLNLQQRLLDLFDITKLRKAYKKDIFTSEEEALRSFVIQPKIK